MVTRRDEEDAMAVEEPRNRSALVIGAQGVLGTLVAAELEARAWTAWRGSRRPGSGAGWVEVDLARPDTVRHAVQGVDAVVNTVPDATLVAERAVLQSGGTLVNVSALPASSGRELRRAAAERRGTVVMNAGIAPGLTNLVAADLLRRHPDADEVELVFTVSTRSSNGPAGGAFAHRNLTGRARHATRVVPLPAPYGRRRVLGFAEADDGWLAPETARPVHTFVCIAEPAVHRMLLALNAVGVMRTLPRAAFRPAPLSEDRTPSSEPVTHWIAVRSRGERVAARTVETGGDYAGAAVVTVAMLEALTGPCRPGPGVFAPEAVLSLPALAPVLDGRGVRVVERTGAGAVPRRCNVARHGAPVAS
jgi:hypothetical protein